MTFEDVPEPAVDPVLCDARRMVEAGIRSKLQIAQLRYNLFSNEENLSYLRNTLLPSVRLQAGASWWQTIGDAELNPVPELQGRDLSAGLLVSMPLFGEQFRTGNDMMIERLDRPTSGAYLFKGEDVTALDDDGESHIRNREIGFIYQNFNLLPRCTAFENVALPLFTVTMSWMRAGPWRRRLRSSASATAGTTVRQGDVLAEFDTSDARSHLENNEERVTSLNQDLETETINWDINLTTEGVRKDQKAEILENARNRKEMSVLERPLPREIGERTFGVADLNLAQSARRITQLQNMSAYELRRRRGHIKYRQRRVDRDAGFIDEYVVRSPADSVVLYPPIPLAGGIVRKVESGDYLEREQAFLRLPDFSTRVLRLRVPEHAVEKIAPDAWLDFHANACPGRQFRARVTSISNLAMSGAGRPYQKFFEVTAEIESARGVEDLKPGMVVSALFTLRDHGEVLAVPRDLTSKNEAGAHEITVESGTGTRTLALPRGVLETEDLLLVPPAAFGSPTGGRPHPLPPRLEANRFVMRCK